MKKLTTTNANDLSEMIENYVRRFNLEEPGSLGVVMNYIQHFKTYDSWEQVREKCFAFERLIAVYLENNYFTENDFMLVQQFAEMVFKYRSTINDEDKWEVFSIFETILHAYETGLHVRFDSLKCIFKVGQYGLDCLFKHPEDESLKLRVRKYLMNLGMTLTKQSNTHRIKYGYQLVMMYKQLTLASDDPKEWLFDLLFRFGQVVGVENRMEVVEHRRVTSKALILVDMLMGKIERVDHEREMYKGKRSYSKLKMTKQVNLWARGVVHLCHFVYELYDEPRAVAQKKEMEDVMNNVLVKRLTRDKFYRLNKSKKCKLSTKEKHAKAKDEAWLEFREKTAEGISVAGGFTAKEEENYRKKYIDKQPFSSMITECESILKRFRATKLPINDVYHVDMIQLWLDLHSWQLDTKVKKKKEWDYISDRKMAMASTDQHKVFYGKAKEWSLQEESDVL